jgi:anthranilate phosphoribosyltransferase
MIASLLLRLEDPRPFTAADARWWYGALLSGRASDGDRMAILAATRARPETAADLAALAREMRRRARPFRVPARDGAIDLCGSGGARRPSFNVSTASAFVVAASGVPVVKHGNRSSRGPCGSSDLLAALGLPVERSPAFARASYRKFGVAFLHAPLFHPATRAVRAARRDLGVPTVFNRLGPLSNPAGVPYQVTGVPDLASGFRVADVLNRLGVHRGLAVCSAEGADEFSPARASSAVVWSGSDRHRRTIRPAALLASEDRRGSWGPLPPRAAALETERVLAGGGGATRGAILLTSGAARWVSGRSATLRTGVAEAEQALDSGSAERLLDGLRRLADRYRGIRGE